MIHGIAGNPIPAHLKYAQAVQNACEAKNFPPCLAYAIFWRESIAGEVAGSWTACSVVSGDGGYGLGQLTYPFTQPWPPTNWEDPGVNASLALEHFMVPALEFFSSRGLVGYPLVACIAAGYNSGIDTAWENHLKGNVDVGTINGYAAAVLANYQRLIAGRDPV